MLVLCHTSVLWPQFHSLKVNGYSKSAFQKPMLYTPSLCQGSEISFRSNIYFYSKDVEGLLVLFFFGRLFLNSSSSQWSHPANTFKCFESKEPTCCVCGIMRLWFLSSLLSDTFPFQITQQGVNLFVALEPLKSPYFSVCFSLFIDLFYVLVRC